MIKVNGKEIEFTQFPNGETNMNHLSFPDVSEQCGTNIVFKYTEDGDIIKLLFVKDYLDSLVGEFHCFHLTMYHIPYGRMDRSENGSPFTLKYFANLINNMEFDGITIIEPHSDVSLQMIYNSVPNYITKQLYRNVMKEVNFDLESDYIMFPDKGAKNRYDDVLFPNILVGEKVRNFETGRIESLDIAGEIKHNPSKVLIMDDLSSYGGTFVMSADKLREIGFKEVYLLVAHAENSIFKGRLFESINKLFTTDSMLTEQDHWQNKKFQPQLKVYKLEEIL